MWVIKLSRYDHKFRETNRMRNCINNILIVRKTDRIFILN